eukprot:TRINITY_DN62675_c0_g1_i1.p1 TRINITY_DN62675_c0_g1~~TRINITY_DN62675_c0_g1_i1.p1  ORF type:complete len:103 (-),score=31.80 TRINITY_DN62675_c0_g1_i1:152-460(-)
MRLLATSLAALALGAVLGDEAEAKPPTELETAEYHQDFKDFDINTDGQIDAQEVRAQFKGELDAKELHQFFIDVDKDTSGTITLQEYVDYAAALNDGGAKLR